VTVVRWTRAFFRQLARALANPVLFVLDVPCLCGAASLAGRRLVQQLDLLDKVSCWPLYPLILPFSSCLLRRMTVELAPPHEAPVPSRPLLMPFRSRWTRGPTRRQLSELKTIKRARRMKDYGVLDGYSSSTSS
jgi:hypothetical protein